MVAITLFWVGTQIGIIPFDRFVQSLEVEITGKGHAEVGDFKILIQKYHIFQLEFGFLFDFHTYKSLIWELLHFLID